MIFSRQSQGTQNFAPSASLRENFYPLLAALPSHHGHQPESVANLIRCRLGMIVGTQKPAQGSDVQESPLHWRELSIHHQQIIAPPIYFGEIREPQTRSLNPDQRPVHVAKLWILNRDIERPSAGNTRPGRLRLQKSRSE